MTLQNSQTDILIKSLKIFIIVINLYKLLYNLEIESNFQITQQDQQYF